MVLLQGLDQKDLYHFKKDNHRIRWSLRPNNSTNYER